jgi:hypothetical protein
MSRLNIALILVGLLILFLLSKKTYEHFRVEPPANPSELVNQRFNNLLDTIYELNSSTDAYRTDANKAERQNLNREDAIKLLNGALNNYDCRNFAYVLKMVEKEGVAPETTVKVWQKNFEVMCGA